MLNSNNNCPFTACVKFIVLLDSELSDPSAEIHTLYPCGCVFKNCVFSFGSPKFVP